MFCKDCKFYKEGADKPYKLSACFNEKLSEDCGQGLEGDELIYPYNEGAVFCPEPNFGCVHFLAK